MNKKVTMTQEAADYLKREGYETAEVGKEYFVLAVGDVGFNDVVIGETPNDYYQFPSIPDYMLGLDAGQIRDEFIKERKEKEINQKREDMKKKRIYISGPISDVNKEKCFEAFRNVEEMLLSKGYSVFNPLKNGLPFESDTHLHMRRDLNVLTNEEDPFDYIFMMKRWAHSAGCTKELEVAISCGISVIFEESSIKDGIEITPQEGYTCITFQ